jgi:uncharacterized protein (TIGR00299 family) protein
MKAIYLDCFAGVSLAKLLGALIASGLSTDFISEKLELLNSTAGFAVKKVFEQGIEACQVDFTTAGHLVSLEEVGSFIEHSPFTSQARTQACEVFFQLAQAEGKVHGCAANDVKFHEVGKLQNVLGVLLVLAGIEHLEIKKIYASRLHVGSGFIDCEHGVLPIPSPAVAELLKNMPIYSTNFDGELITPTSAALLKVIVTDYGSIPASFKVNQIFYGGGREKLKLANVLRIYFGYIKCQGHGHDDIKIVETNIDDMNPELYGYVLEELYREGALDVYFTPITMKKNRPGIKISITAASADLKKLINILLTETTTVGVRVIACDAYRLETSITTVESRYGAIRVKIAQNGEKVLNASPEYEDCKIAARLHGIPIKEVYNSALFKYIESGV